jgi:hypothetical protein
MPPAGGAGGGGEVVNEEAFKAVAEGLKAQASIHQSVFFAMPFCTHNRTRFAKTGAGQA